MPEKQPHEFEPLIRAASTAEKLSRELGGSGTYFDKKTLDNSDILEILKRFGIREDTYTAQMKEFEKTKAYNMCWKESNKYDINQCLIEKLEVVIKKSKPQDKKYWTNFKKILEEINKKIYYGSGLYEQLNRMKTLINY